MAIKLIANVRSLADKVASIRCFLYFLIAFLIRFHNFALPLRPNSTKWEIIIQKQGGLKGKPLYKNSYG